MQCDWMSEAWWFVGRVECVVSSLCCLTITTRPGVMNELWISCRCCLLWLPCSSAKKGLIDIPLPIRADEKIFGEAES